MLSETELHQLIRARDLEERNYAQASQLMQLWQEIRALKTMKKEIKRLTEDLKEEREKKNNVIPFARPAMNIAFSDGGGSSGNWLINLDEGCVFHSKPRRPESQEVSDCEQWHIAIKWKKSVLLYTNLPRGEGYRIVHADVFSKANELVEIIRQKRQTFDD
jgi:hypothetical protein